MTKITNDIDRCDLLLKKYRPEIDEIINGTSKGAKSTEHDLVQTFVALSVAKWELMDKRAQAIFKKKKFDE